MPLPVLQLLPVVLFWAVPASAAADLDAFVGQHCELRGRAMPGGGEVDNEPMALGLAALGDFAQWMASSASGGAL